MSSIDVNTSGTGGQSLPGVSSTTAANVGFMGSAPREKPAAYSLAASGNRTLKGIVTAEVSTANPLGVLTAFAFTEAQAKGLLIGQNSLRAEVKELKEILGQLIADLQSYGLLQ